MKPILILFSLYALLSCSTSQKRDRLLTEQLDAAFDTVFNSDEPGGSVIILQGDNVLYQKSFGIADMKTNEKFTSQTVSNIGSITKTFVAYGILILQNQGKLSVEDSIIKYFPEFKNKELASKIEIKHLLSHTSGLPDCRNVEGDSVFYLTAKDKENFSPLTLTDTLEFEPGTEWNYSNPSYNGLALIIEKVSGMKWQEFIRQNIFLPSGMNDSKITDGSYPESGVAHGYIHVNNKFEEYDYGEFPTFAAAGNGGVWGSVEDLRKYVIAINNFKFIDSANISLTKKIWMPDNWNPKDTVGHSGVWFVHPSFTYYNHDDEQCNVIEHSGSQGGFRAHLVMIPENDITVIYLTNNDKHLSQIIRKTLLGLKYIR